MMNNNPTTTTTTPATTATPGTPGTPPVSSPVNLRASYGSSPEFLNMFKEVRRRAMTTPRGWRGLVIPDGSKYFPERSVYPDTLIGIQLLTTPAYDPNAPFFPIGVAVSLMSMEDGVRAFPAMIIVDTPPLTLPVTTTGREVCNCSACVWLRALNVAGSAVAGWLAPGARVDFGVPVPCRYDSYEVDSGYEGMTNFLPVWGSFSACNPEWDAMPIRVGRDKWGLIDFRLSDNLSRASRYAT